MTLRPSHVLSSGLVVIFFAVGSGPARTEQPPKGAKEILTIRTECWGVRSLTLSPDGKRIVTGNLKFSKPYLLVHDADTGKMLHKIEQPGDGVLAVAVTPDGKRVAGTLPGKVVFWDATTGKHDVEYEVGIKSPLGLAFTPDYTRFVVGGGEEWNVFSRPRRGDLKVFQAHTGKQVFDLKGQGSLVTSVAVTADGKRLVSGGWNGTAKVWDLETGKELLTLKGHQGGILSVAISPDGKRIVTAGGGKFYELGDSIDYEQSAEVKVWDAESGKEVLDLEGQTKAVRSVAFSPDGKHIAGGGLARVLVVWDADSGRLLTTYTGHTEVMSLTYRPGGKRIVSGGEDTLIKVWAVPTK